MHKTLDERLDLTIANQFTCCLMSNAKWRKVFHILCSPELGHMRFRFKEVGREERPNQTLDKLLKPDMIGERWIGDCLSGGPLYYRAIEWIEIPAQYVERSPERQVVWQDIVEATRALSQAGQFPIELTDAWLRLYGYR